jgi:hypothetical protein
MKKEEMVCARCLCFEPEDGPKDFWCQLTPEGIPMDIDSRTHWCGSGIWEEWIGPARLIRHWGQWGQELPDIKDPRYPPTVTVQKEEDHD